MTHPWRRYETPAVIAAKRRESAERKEAALGRQARYSPSREPVNRFSQKR